MSARWTASPARPGAARAAPTASCGSNTGCEGAPSPAALLLAARRRRRRGALYSSATAPAATRCRRCATDAGAEPARRLGRRVAGDAGFDYSPVLQAARPSRRHLGCCPARAFPGRSGGDVSRASGWAGTGCGTWRTGVRWQGFWRGTRAPLLRLEAQAELRRDDVDGGAVARAEVAPEEVRAAGPAAGQRHIRRIPKMCV